MSNTPIGHSVTERKLVVKQGSTLSLVLTFRDSAGDLMNLTGFTFTGQVRKTALASSVAASFSFDTSQAATGVITATLAGTDTASMTVGETQRSEDSQYWYDLRYVSGGISTYFLEGPLTLNRRVTR